MDDFSEPHGRVKLKCR